MKHPGYPGLWLAFFLGFVLYAAVYGGEPANVPPDAAVEQKIHELTDLAGTYCGKEPKKAMDYGKEALELLRRFPIQAAEMTVSGHLSTACIWLGDYTTSEKYALQSLSLARELNNNTGAADALYNLGWAYWSQGRYTEALDHCKSARKLYYKNEYRDGLARCLLLRGMIAWKLGNFSKALEFTVDASSLFSLIEDRIGIADSNLLKGNISFETGEYQKALDYFSAALTTYDDQGQKTGVVRTLNNTGFTYDKMGNPTEALNYYRKSLQISEDIGTLNLTSIIYSSMGEAYARLRDDDQALTYFNKALEIERSLKDSMGIAYELIQIGITKRHLGRLREAHLALMEALELSKKLQIRRQIKTACKELADIYIQLGDHREAFAYYKEYKRIDSLMFNEKSRKKMVDVQAIYEPAKKEKELALLKKDKQLQQLEIDHLANIRIFSSITTALVLLLAFILYRGYRQKKETAKSLSNEIAEHKQTELKLRESEENFRTLAEKAVVGICIVQDNQLRYTNPAYLAIFGFTAEDVPDLNPCSPVVEEDRRMVEEKRGLCSGPDAADFVTYEFRGIAKGGKVLHLESYCVRVPYQDRPALLETIVDITDRKNAEAELLKMRKLESVGIMAGNIARDFDRLLADVISNAGSLETAVNNRRLAGIAGNLKTIALKASQLASRLIVFSGGGEAVCRKLTVPAILNSTTGSYPQLQKLIRSTSFPPDLKPVKGDEAELTRVLGSLLWNAKEAGIDGSDTVVTITAQNTRLPRGNALSLKAGDYVLITVSDNGKGIPAHQLEKVFDPYFSTKETFHEKGLGLGLAICYSIIKKHQGHISIKSREGEGASVELLLPAYSRKRGTP